MAEPLTTALVLEEIGKLVIAFPRSKGENPQALVDVYRNGLNGCSGDSVRAAVRSVIETDAYFPKVSRIRELAFRVDSARRARERLAHPGTVSQTSDDYRCPQCRELPTWRETWVVQLGDRGRVLVVVDGSGDRWVLLTRLERLRCRCDRDHARGLLTPDAIAPMAATHPAVAFADARIPSWRETETVPWSELAARRVA